MKLLAVLLRVALGGVFIYASVDKILHPHDFAVIVKAYRILPDLLVNPVAVILPWLELVLGLCLVLNVWVSGALLLANTLLVAFLSMVILNGLRGIDVACGCFTTDATAHGSFLWYVTRDSLLLLLGAAAAYVPRWRPDKA